MLYALEQYVKKNEELKAQLKNSLDSMVEASSRYENKFAELHTRVIEKAFVCKKVILDK